MLICNENVTARSPQVKTANRQNCKSPQNCNIYVRSCVKNKIYSYRDLSLFFNIDTRTATVVKSVYAYYTLV